MNESRIKRGLEYARKGIERINGRTEPFVIRGHHLPFLTRVMQDGADEATMALLEGTAASENPIYLEDVLGRSSTHADQYTESVKNFFKIFEQIPNSHPVKIVEMQKDKICKACASGNHCSDLILDDGLAIHRFITKARSSGLMKKVKVTRSAIPTTNGKDFNITTVDTRAGVIRAIAKSDIARYQNVN